MKLFVEVVFNGVKKYPFRIILLLVIFTIVIILCAKLFTESVGDEDILKAGSNIVANAILSQSILNGISETWRDAIEKYGKFFNEPIRAFLNSEGIQLQLEQIATTDTEIKEQLQRLSKYSFRNKEKYNELMNLYGVYSQLYSLAKEPTGSLKTFNAKVNDLSSEFTRIRSRIEIYNPEIRNLASTVFSDKMNKISTALQAKIVDEMDEIRKADSKAAEKAMERLDKAEAERRAVVEETKKQETENSKTVETELFYLDGVFTGKNGNQLAMISGKTYGEGETVGDIKIDRINNSSIDIIVNGTKKNVKVGNPLQ